MAKPSLKIESVNKPVLFWYWQRPKKYLFSRNNFFFVIQDRIKLSASVWKKIPWNLTKFQLNKATDLKVGRNNFDNKTPISHRLVLRNTYLHNHILEKEMISNCTFLMEHGAIMTARIKFSSTVLYKSFKVITLK